MMENPLSLLIERFSGFEQHAFLWEGGKPAVLLVHGFPGTPAEMRPLAEIFHVAGWTAQGILLPGFGPDLGTLFARTHDDWATAIREALEALRREHAPVVLLGHSMGGALALRVAAETPPDALILLAPFWRFASVTPLFQLLWPAFRRVVRTLRPFSRLDPQNRDVRAAIGQYFPEFDLDDPAVLAALREFSVPTSVFEQLRRAGEAGRAAAGRVHVPTLAVQGLQDGLIPLQRTRTLVMDIPGPLHYHEFDGPHELVDPQAVSWPMVSAVTLEFVRRFMTHG